MALGQSAKYDEKYLLQQVAEGDENAFAQLFNQHHQHLGRYIFSIIKSDELTKDIVQDVFVKIWQTRESLTSFENFSDYLFIITRNQAISAVRKLLSERSMLKQLKQNHGDMIESIDPGFTDKGLSLIDEAVSRLPEQQKKCFVLSRREKLTYEEIAIRLGIGRETVKTHIQLAVSAISKYVKSEMNKALLLLWLAMHIN